MASMYLKIPEHAGAGPALPKAGLGVTSRPGGSGVAVEPCDGASSAAVLSSPEVRLWPLSISFS